MKKWLCIFVLLALLLTGCGGRVDDNLPFSGGSGFESDPYRIATASDLKELADKINSEETAGQFGSLHYVLTADIDLGGKAWEGIHTFSGILDGAGHTIRGLKLNYKVPLVGNPVNEHGLIGLLKGTVKNLTVSDSSFASVEKEHGGYIGAIAGELQGGIIVNCHTTDTVQVSGSHYAGGICGNADAHSEISGCSNAAQVSGVGNISGVAGIAGRAACPVADCTNSGAVTSEADAAGIVCSAVNSVTDCVNSGAVHAADFAGGIVTSFSDGALNSSMNNGEVTLLRCTNSGAVSSESDPAGGIAAGCRTGIVQDCVNSGDVTSGAEAGGILGFFQPSSFGTPCERFLVSGCVNTGSVTGTDSLGLHPAAGICGTIYQCETELVFENCENQGAVRSTCAAGGIVGKGNVHDLKLLACMNSGAVAGTEFAGGMMGEAQPAEITETAAAVIRMENCVNTGSIYAELPARFSEGVFIGGMLGDINEFFQRFADVRFENCENRGALDGSREGRGYYADDLCAGFLLPDEMEGES